MDKEKNFSGSYTNNLDSKGRVSLPFRFRESLGGRVFITKGTDNKFLWLFTEDGWFKYLEKLNNLPNSIAAKHARRYLIGNAYECEIDKLGRIQIPAPLRDFAGLGKEVLFMGNGSNIEIWKKSEKEKLDAEVDEAGGIQKYMEELNL